MRKLATNDERQLLDALPGIVDELYPDSNKLKVAAVVPKQVEPKQRICLVEHCHAV